MLKLLLIIGLIPYSLVFVANIPHFVKEFARVKGQVLLFCVACASLLIGQGQMFSHAAYTPNSSIFDAGMIYQISWMAVGGAFLAILFVQNGYSQYATRLPIIMLAIYAILGVITSPISPAPLFSAYRAMQVVLDFMMVAVAVQLLVRAKRPELLLDLTIFLLSLIIVSAAAGGVFVPDRAFIELYGGGAFGKTLTCVFPEIFSNELGILSASLVIVSLRRMVENGQPKLRKYYWMSLCLLSLMVMIGAQSRTSIGAFTISAVVMTYYIPRLRWVNVVIIIGAIALLLYYFLYGTELGFEDVVAEYLRRGATDAQLTSLTGRTGLWEAGFEMFKAHPFVGYGFQAGARMAGAAFGIASGMNMHNAHMQVLVDSGLLGYFFWIMFVLPMFILPISVLKKKALSLKTEVGRFHLEVTLIMFAILFRTFLGQILVTHQISTMLYLGGYVYVLVSLILRKNGTNITSESRLVDELPQKLNYIPRRKL